MKKFFALILSLLLLVALGALADETAVPVQVTVTFGQTEARSMLAMINDFRDSGAKCWNETNTDEIEYRNDPLKYDYTLEEVAMQRAAEIALYFSHTRPDNTRSLDTAFPSSGFLWLGENIAAGQKTAEEAFNDWREDGEPYAGQGHRRNMLDENANCIGIGHAIVNGRHFWTHALGNFDNPNETKTNAVDAVKTVTINVLPSLVDSISFSETPIDKLELEASLALPAISFTMKKTVTTGQTIPYMPVNAADQAVWSSSDTAKITVADGKFTAAAVGDAILSTTAFGKTLNVPLTVTARSIANATLTLTGAENLKYTGTAQEPAVTVKDGDTLLEKDKDYSVDYTDNTKASTDSAKAKVTVSGKGNYTGTLNAEFTIGKAALTVTAKDKTIVYGDAPANDGVTITGFVNSETEAVLDGELVFAYSYKQYGDIGDACTITPSGLTSGNYDITFANGTLKVTPKAVGLTWGDTEFTYDGEEHLPTATITGTVNSDTVTAAVTGGETDAGENYTATVTGLTGDKAGNYSLPETVTASFTIKKATPVVTAPVPAEGLVENGKEQTLITAGATTGGTMKYSLEKEGTYSETLPAAKDGGSYTVWYKVEGGANYEDVAPQSVTAKIKKLYTIHFDGNGGTGTMPDVEIEDGKEYELPECAFKAPDGKVFSGWMVGKDTTEKAVGDKITVTGDITIKAIWKDKPADTIAHTIKFNANGGTGTMPDVEIEDGEEYELPECAFGAPEGKEFSGWQVGEDTAEKAVGDKITVTADITVKAIWKDEKVVTCTITFNANGGSGTMAKQTAAKGSNVTLNANKFKRTWYTFNGWNTQANGKGTTYNNTASITLTKNITLYAQWKAQKKLTLKKLKIVIGKELTLTATLKIGGKAVKGKIIKFRFNKKTYKAKTNKKGIAKVTIKAKVTKKLKTGKKYTIIAMYSDTKATDKVKATKK